MVRHEELTFGQRIAQLNHWLETEVWSHIPPEHLGRRLIKEEEEKILGIGPEGY